MARWGMVINTHTCIGCYNCMIACKAEHFLPPGIFFARVLIGESGRYPSVRKLIYPVLCNHCEDPSCVDVCPTGATTQREDGIVTVDQDICIGCRNCLIACPYQQRSYLSKDEREYFPGQGLTPFEEIGKVLYPLEKGTVAKCTFCIERIDEGLKKGLTTGVDRDATPACVNACPVSARHFGDLDDPVSNVSVLIRDKKAAPLHPEYGTQPSVYYITTG
ncbi:MAG TPA: 4Fe-4S dicluster domain-containing protein [Desulfatiglandales bacterium]|nr:4Fe-4S dicluster domain-containing protein [Desulfatiglandales bacterium]